MAVRVDRIQSGLSPEQRVGAAAGAAFDRQRPGDVDHDLGIGGETNESSGKIVVGKRRLSHGERHHGERIVELAQGHGLGLAAVAQAGGLRAGYVESVGDAVEAALRRKRVVSPFAARIRQRDKVSGQIAAVD
ncbi:MAG: hypothetical protein ACLPSW_36310, partial [Roseiarcus sp.]